MRLFMRGPSGEFYTGFILYVEVVDTLKSTRGFQVPIYRMKNQHQGKMSKTRTVDGRRKAE